MTKGLYTARNYIALPLHYALTAGIATGAWMIGQPWAIGLASTATLGLMAPILWLNKEVMENHLEAHPKIHPHSPRLGEIVSELYQASGLKSEKKVIYSFTPTPKKLRPYDDELRALYFKLTGKRVEFKKIKEDGLDKDQIEFISWTIKQRESEDEPILKKIINECKDYLRSQKNTLNAAATRLGKPIIMISEPMLKLLDDDEEKAVLAHEFAHAAAHHITLSLPVTLLNMTSKGSVFFTKIAAAFSVGPLAFASSIAGLIGASAVIQKLQGDNFKPKDKDKMTIPEMHQKKKFKKHRKSVIDILTLGVFTLQNPAFASIWLAAKGIGVSTNLVAGSLSRSKEYQADRGAAVLGASPLALMTSLRKISFVYTESIKKAWDNQPVPQPGSLTKVWKRATASHPTLERRLERLSEIARRSGYSEQDIETAKTGPLNIKDYDDIPIEVIREAMSHFIEHLDSEAPNLTLIP